METKSINVDKATYRRFLLQKAVPAIRAKWPAMDRRCTVFIQTDNASAHTEGSKSRPKPEDAQFAKDWEELCLDARERVQIKMREQAPNSPDHNTNDLGFFNSLQSDAWALTPATTIDGLVSNVEQAFAQYDPGKLNRIWLTHGAVLNETIHCNGGNDYKLPHMYKDGKAKRNSLPKAIALSETASEHYRCFKNPIAPQTNVGENTA